MREHKQAGLPSDQEGPAAREPKLPPPTAGTPPSLPTEPAYRVSAVLPYLGTAVGGIALVLILGMVFVAKPLATSAKAQAAPPQEKPSDTASTEKKSAGGGGFLTKRKPAEAELPRAKTSVMVLNGSGRSGGAQRAATRLETKNYRVVSVNNASHSDYKRTLVLYRSGFKGEAERLARDLGLGWKRVAPVDGMKRRELGEARIVLILGG